MRGARPGDTQTTARHPGNYAEIQTLQHTSRERSLSSAHIATDSGHSASSPHRVGQHGFLTARGTTAPVRGFPFGSMSPSMGSLSVPCFLPRSPAEVEAPVVVVAVKPCAIKRLQLPATRARGGGGGGGGGGGVDAQEAEDRSRTSSSPNNPNLSQ